jgi:hypothetical protein
MAGLVAGATTMSLGCKGNNGGSGNSTTMNAAGTSGETAMQAKHDCAGKNACKGQGGCSSGDNGCKGKNSCKGKGGCHMT